MNSFPSSTAGGGVCPASSHRCWGGGWAVRDGDPEGKGVPGACEARPSDSGSRPDLSSQRWQPRRRPAKGQWPAPARLPVRRGRAESGRQKEGGDRKPSRTWGYANTCVACARSGLLTICRPVYQRIRSKARNGKTSFPHSSVCKIAPSLLPPSLPVFVCVLFMGTLEDLVSQTANLKGTNWQTRGNSQSTLIRGGACNSLTLETRNQLPFFQSLWRQQNAVQIDTEVFILVFPFLPGDMELLRSEQLFWKGGR